MTPQNNPTTDQNTNLLSLFLTYSPTDALVAHNLNLVKTFLEQYYFIETDDKTFEQIVERVNDRENVTETDLKLLTDIYQHHLSSFPRETFYAALDGLGTNLYSLPRLMLQIPVRLDTHSLQQIATWVRTNISSNMLLSVRVNPLLIAGCGVGWESQYAEFSLDQKIHLQKDRLFSLLPKL